MQAQFMASSIQASASAFTSAFEGVSSRESSLEFLVLETTSGSQSLVVCNHKQHNTQVTTNLMTLLGQ
jgi:hypothetical protein